MKKLMLFVLMTLIVMSVCLTVADALDAPQGGGKTVFGVDDIMYPGDEGTKFHNAFTNPSVKTPDGSYEHWSGAYFTPATYKGLECVAVSIDPEGNTLSPVMDFNYYQWDADYYNPSLDATEYRWLKIKYAYNDAAEDIDYIKFWASKDVRTLGVNNLKSAYLAADIVNNGKWKEVIIDLSKLRFQDGTLWNKNTIRQFRLQMFEGNENEDAVCYIAGFGFFETKADARSWEFGEEVPDNSEDDTDNEKPVIKLSGVSGRAGDSVKVTVALRDNPGVMQMGLTVKYDRNALTLTEVIDGGLLGKNYSGDNYKKYPYVLNWSNNFKNEYGNGVIATLVFEINEDAKTGTYPVSISYDNDNDDIINEDFKPVSFAVSNGEIEVLPDVENVVVGDVSGDEKVTSKDTALLARYLSNYEEYENDSIILEAADVDGDGVVSALDAIILARYIARWTGYDKLPYGG